MKNKVRELANKIPDGLSVDELYKLLREVKWEYTKKFHVTNPPDMDMMMSISEYIALMQVAINRGSSVEDEDYPECDIVFGPIEDDPTGETYD